MSVWIIRIFFLSLCTLGGYAVGEVHPYYQDVAHAGYIGMAVGFGFGWMMIAIDEMVKGFSLRAFSATTFGLLLGTVVALMVDKSGLFENVDEKPTRWLIRLCLFLAFPQITGDLVNRRLTR